MLLNLHHIKLYMLSLCFLSLNLSIFSQDLDQILEQEAQDINSLVLGTFNGTRILNGHSVETRKKGILEFMISHRFGEINSGFDQLFGLDDSNIRFGFEYAFTDNLTIALGRSSFEKTFDGYIKYRLLTQETASSGFPFSLTLFVSSVEKTLKNYAENLKPTFAERLTYTSQIMVARKFDENFSLQIIPTYIHFNQSLTALDPNDIYALGLGTRVKISPRVSLNGEYYIAFNSYNSIDAKNSLAFGVDIETGGHIFQLILSNSRAMIEKGFIVENTGDFFKGDIHFGFNISRAFQINRTNDPKKLY